MSGQLKNEIHSCDICLREAIFYEYKSKSYHANLCVRCLGIAISRHKNIQTIKIINTNQVIVSQSKPLEPKLEVERVKRPPSALPKSVKTIKKPCPMSLKPAEKQDISQLIRKEMISLLKEEMFKSDQGEAHKQDRGETQKRTYVDPQKFDIIPKIKKP
jgi:hypothetical protein